MQAQEQALARQRAYHELGQIFLYGASQPHLEFLQTVLPEDVLLSLPPELEELAADHYQLFGLNIFPYATIFLHHDTMLGTVVSNNVETFYHEVGFMDYVSDIPDHVGNGFALLSFLSGAEADAYADQVLHEARRMQHLQGRFLQEYLLRWLPALHKTVLEHHHALYGTLLELGLQLTLSQYEAIAASMVTAEINFELPEPPALLENDKTGLKDIAEYLLVPAYAGFYLSRDTIRQLGTIHNLPHGFGKRQQILTNLIRTAVDYDLLEDVMVSLQNVRQSWQDYYEACLENPSLEPFVEPWLKRLNDTASLIEIITTAIQTHSIVEE